MSHPMFDSVRENPETWPDHFGGHKSWCWIFFCPVHGCYELPPCDEASASCDCGADNGGSGGGLRGPTQPRSE